jgi:catechol 2,3-dioxygenase-like lactoylglutathione lyase family enzyme
MQFAQRHAITDTCTLVRDREASIAFYRDKLGFALQPRAPGIADFSALALWARAHIARRALRRRR